MAKEQGGCELPTCKKMSARAGQNVLNYTSNPRRTSATPHFYSKPSSP